MAFRRATFTSVTDTASTQNELWGGETRKAIANFPVSGEPIPAPVARWLGRLKAAAARTNAELGLLDADKAQRIAAAGDRIAAGELDDQFPIDVFQTGSGTSSNTNANEVIANIAGDGVHPNDDVNMGQSSNDVFPSAVHLAALEQITTDLLPALDGLASALGTKAGEFADIVKSGRTHWMDAVPVTLGQEFGGYAAQVREGKARVTSTLGRLGQIPLGGTATGTGLNTHPEFAARVRDKLVADTGLVISPPADAFESQAARDGLVEASGALKTLAVSLTKVANDLRPALDGLAGALEAKAAEFADVVKSGRTHWMDAVPVTLGQEFAGYAMQVREGDARIAATLERLGKIPLGGTAVGTGLNTHPEFAARVRAKLAADSGLTISPPADPFESQAARDGLVEASAALKTLAVSLTKIANDLRFLGSGPRAGLAEIFLPELQKGSSIMPGKVNPVIPEVVTQVAAQVIGNDQAITVGGMQAHFELNVFVPLIARNLLQSIRLLASSCRLLDEKCVAGIEANREQCESYAELTLSAATALNPYIGYDKAGEIVKKAAASGRSLREVAREEGVSDDVLDEALDYRKMAKPHG